MADKKRSEPRASPSAKSNSKGVDSGLEPERIDEYIDDKYDVNELDALDVPSALLSEEVLGDIPDDGDGIEEHDVLASTIDDDETVDTGYRRHHVEEGDMGLGAEPHSAEELEEAALGEEARHSRGIIRDNEAHGRGLLDRP
jgi:hypothetical protein